MASAAVDNAKAFAEEQLATLRVKLNQIPALQQVEVSERESFGLCISSDNITSGSRKQHESVEHLMPEIYDFDRRKRREMCDLSMSRLWLTIVFQWILSIYRKRSRSPRNTLSLPEVSSSSSWSFSELVRIPCAPSLDLFTLRTKRFWPLNTRTRGMMFSGPCIGFCFRSFPWSKPSRDLFCTGFPFILPSSWPSCFGPCCPRPVAQNSCTTASWKTFWRRVPTQCPASIRQWQRQRSRQMRLLRSLWTTCPIWQPRRTSK